MILKIIAVIIAIVTALTSIPVYNQAKQFNFKEEPKLAVQKSIRKFWEDAGNKIIYDKTNDLDLNKIQYTQEGDNLSINIDDNYLEINKIKLNNKTICSCMVPTLCPLP